MKRILATVALVSLLAACTNATEDSPTTDDAPDTNGSSESGIEEPDTEPGTESESPDDEPESPDGTDSDPSDDPVGDGFGSMDGDDESVDFSDFTIEETQSEGFPDLLGDFLPITARVGGHEGYDRVVVEYDAGEGQLNWGAWYDDAPIQDGSGFTADMEGDMFLTLSVSGVRYPEESEVVDGITTAGLNQSAIIDDVHVDYTFEGMHRIFIGLDEQRPYRVQAFHDPTRLVIDIQND